MLKSCRAVTEAVVGKGCSCSGSGKTVVVVEEEAAAAVVAGVVYADMHLEIVVLCVHAPAVTVEWTCRMMRLQYKNSRQRTSKSYMSCLTGYYSLRRGPHSCKGSWALVP